MTERMLLKLGAVSYIVGIILVIVTELMHPHDQPAHETAKALSEYAHNPLWREIHVAQFFAIFLLLSGFLALYKYLKQDEGITAALAWFGAVATVVAITIFALLQAIDGYTLIHVTENWINAPTEQKDAAYRVAESIRWIEVAFNAYFRILTGVVLLLFGLAVSFTRLLPRWPGWVAIAGGISSIIFGMQVGRYGFAPEATLWSNITLFFLLIWVISMTILMWKRSNAPLKLKTKMK